MGDPKTLPKSERLTLFRAQVNLAPNVSTRDGAVELLASCLNKIEDEFSGVPYNPYDRSGPSDGRMYPPDWQYAKPHPTLPDVTIFRQTGHRTLVGSNGAILIERLMSPGSWIAELDKPGQDGRKISEL